MSTQLIIGVAGAAVGFAIGGPVGAQWGWAVGSAVGAVVGAPDIQGPRLSDLRVQNSSYGASEAICYGGVRLAGNVIWAADLVEHEHEEGKGGSATSFSYTGSLAVNICAGEHQSIRRIWADSKLVYDATDTATAEALEASAAFAEFFIYYTGSEAQLADPTMEAALGVGNVPGYRGSAYIVFTDLPLQAYGNRIPSFSFELSGQTQGAACAVPGIINDLLAVRGTGPESGSVILTWSAASGATYYDIYVSKDGADAVKINGIPWTTLTTGYTTAWDLMAVYTYWVIAVNTCGETRGNDQATRWVGTINGTGAWDEGEWVQVCHDYYFDSAAGYYGVGNPGSQTFGNSCYRYYAGNYAGALVATDIAFENLGGLFAVGGGATIGIVAASSTFLSTIITDIGTRCGLNSARNDVSALTAIVVDGYIVSRQMSGRSACESLQRAYYVDVVESGDGIRWVVRGGASAVTIGYDDLGAGEEEAEETAVVPLRAQETDLPSRVNVAYMAKTRDFETGAQTDRRMTTGSQQVVSIELPIVMSDLKGKQVASVLMYDAWTSRNQRSWSTTRKYAKYEPTDIVTLDDDQFVYTVRITEKSEEGPVIKWKGVDDSVAGYSPNVTAATGYSSSTIRFTGGTMRLELLDVPIVRDEDNASGYYAAGSGLTDSWAGGRYYRSLDAGASYATVDDLSVAATLGDARTILGNYSGGNTVDELNTVTVLLTSGTLSTVTQAQLLNGANLALLGDELIQFKRATLLTTDTYILSGLLRGRRGTEQYMATHTVIDRFVLFSETSVYRETDALSNIGVSTLAKGVTIGRSLAGTTAEAFTNTGAAIKPLSVAHLAAINAGGGNYTVKWVRRSRIGGEWRNGVGVDVPLGETTEQYSIDVVRAGAVISTATVTTNTATVAAIATDIVRVRQRSELVGLGFAAEVTLN